MQLELISFDICPFVQRSVITLLYKNEAFDITYIDLENPPAWFLDISPFGKVPVLRVGESAVFESAVINEYVDEITPGALMPADALLRATNRAWIVFGEACIVDQYNLSVAKTRRRYEDVLGKARDNLQRLEAIMGEGPFFNGADFSLVDAAYAPLFMRYAILNQRVPVIEAAQFPKLLAWSEQLLALDAVQGSVKEDFEALYIDYIRTHADYAAGLFCV